MLKRMTLILLAAAAVCCACAALAESAVEFADLKSISEMDYLIGPELEPGEYIFFSLPGEVGTIRLATDLSDEEVITQESFEANTILSVEEGQYLFFTNSIAYSTDDFYQRRSVGAGCFSVMLKVGFDLEPGRYDLETKPGKSGKYRIYNASRRMEADLMEEGEGEKLPQIELQEGQYLQLIDCRVAGGDERLVIDRSAASGAKTPGAAGVILMDCNVRSQPNAEGSVLAVARYGKTFELLETNENWYKIRLETGVEGWIRKIMAMMDE